MAAPTSCITTSVQPFARQGYFRGVDESGEGYHIRRSSDEVASGHVEPIEIHDLVPRGHEVAHEPLPRVVAGVDLGERTQRPSQEEVRRKVEAEYQVRVESCLPYAETRIPGARLA